MSTTPFVIPEGLVLTQGDDGLSIEHSGTIELHATLGGPISRLVSTGGDVILHLPLELGHVEAAGAVRTTADLQASTVVGDSVHIAGDLRTDELRARGTVRVDGNLEGGSVECEGLTCTELRATHLVSQGGVETSGDVELQTLEATDFSCAGDASVATLSATGAVSIIGAFKGESLSADSLQTGSDVDTRTLQTGGSADIGGSISADQVSASGDLKAGGELDSQSLEIGGDLSVSGSVNADAVAVLGQLSATGDLNARTVLASAISVGGGMQISESLSTEGALEISGDVAINKLSAGDLALGGGVIATLLTATGALRTSGDVQADRIKGGQVSVDGGNLRVKVVEGTESVHVGAAAVRCDIIIAPTVTLDPAATGRVSVLESTNEVGASMIKGCLSLEDLDDLFGNADQFLADRGVHRPGQAPASQAEVQVDIEDSNSLLPDDVEDEASDVSMLEDDTAPEQVAAAPEPTDDEDVEDEETRPADAELMADVQEAAAEAESAEVEAIDEDDGEAAEAVEAAEDGPPDNGAGEEDLFGWADQMLTEVVNDEAIHHPDAEQESGGIATVRVDDDVEETTPDIEDLDEIEEIEEIQSVTDIEPLDEAAVAEVEAIEDADATQEQAEEDPIHGQMQDTINRIVTCYVHAEMPPAVSRLKDLVDARDYTQIRADITDIWNQLLKFHQKRGMRIQPQVTTTFNTINSLVRKL